MKAHLFFLMISCSALGHRDYGRFGNQIFQYSLCKVLSIIHNQPFYLNPPDHFLNFFDREWLSFNRADVFDQNKYIENNAYSFDSTIFKRKNIDLIGFFQNLSYYENYLSEIITELRPNPKILNQSYNYIVDNIGEQNIDNTICVHVRRGDYKNLQNLYGYLDTNYFNYIIKSIEPSYIFIISDEIDLVKHEFIDCKELKKHKKVIFIDNLDIYHEFYIMYLCRHGIISNSSFSWWSKVLSNYLNDKIIYIPKPWLRASTNHENINLYPKNCKNINRSNALWDNLFTTTV